MSANKNSSSSFLNCIFILFAICICLLVVFPEQYYLFNIVLVILLLFYHILANELKINVSIILVGFIAILMILATLDMSRISLLVFFLFLQTKSFYTHQRIKQYQRVMVICLVLVLVAYYAGFRSEYDAWHWSPSLQTYILEKAMGFTNANRCMLFVFCTSCLVLLTTKKTSVYLLILVLNYILYLPTKSRTFFYMIVLIVAVLLILKLFRCESKYSFLGKMVPMVYVLLFLLSLILPIFFSNSYLNALFTNRLAHNKAFIDTGITLLGNSALETETFDSAYLHMLLTKGVIHLAIYSFILLYNCWKVKISNKRAVMLIAVMTAGFMEVIFLESNILFLIGALLYMDENEGNTHG